MRPPFLVAHNALSLTKKSEPPKLNGGSDFLGSYGLYAVVTPRAGSPAAGRRDIKPDGKTYRLVKKLNVIYLEEHQKDLKTKAIKISMGKKKPIN